MLEVNGALDVIFLGCLFFGLIFTLGSLLLGVVDVGHDVGGHDAGDHGPLGPISISSLLAFAALFGAAGYLAHNAAGLLAAVSLALAIIAGLVGAVAASWVLAKLKASERIMNPADYKLPGTLARVSSSIRVGGVGEIIYEQKGIRQVAAARSSDGRAIGRGTEVVILETIGGFALVQPFDELLEDRREHEREPDRLPAT
jgi:hypothetical protein